MLSHIESKARNGDPLSESDERELRQTILYSDDIMEIQSAMYLYGYNFRPDKDVTSRANYFIRTEQHPGLTATCLKVVCDYWGLASYYHDEFVKFVDYDLYDDLWYDEVIVTVSFLSRNPEYVTPDLTKKLERFRKSAIENGNQELLEILQPH